MLDQVGHFLETMQAERNSSENTVAAYRNDLTQLTDYMKQPGNGVKSVSTWSDLQEDHLNGFLEHMREQGYASSTVARKTAAAKSFATWLNTSGVTYTNVGNDVASPRVAKYAPRAITVDEVERLLEIPDHDETLSPDKLRDYAMLELLYATGMRVSELTSLDVEDVDIGAGTVTCAGKSGTPRVLDISDRAIDAVEAYLEDGRPRMSGSQTSTLFLNQRGGRLTRQGFWLILKSYAERAGVGEMTPHTLRHSFAVHEIRRGRNLREVGS